MKEYIYKLYQRTSPISEHVYYFLCQRALTKEEFAILRWLVAETYEPELTSKSSFFDNQPIVEIGPRLTIETPFSSCRVSAVHVMGVSPVMRIEQSNRYLVTNDQTAEFLINNRFDRMTEEIYADGITTFNTGIVPEPVKIVDLIGGGKAALEEANRRLGLGMDAADVEYYYRLFVEVWKRNPTDVELFQIGNGNSEHSRHGYFKGRQVIDGTPMPHTLMELVQRPLYKLDNDSVSLKSFNDNAGVIRGFRTKMWLPRDTGKPSTLVRMTKIMHITMTAETHNFPTEVAPFPGAATGVGGRIRDTWAVGKGSLSGVGVVGILVGNLFIPGYKIPGEVVGQDKPSKYAPSRVVLIEGSTGYSSYSNEYGEPFVGSSFCRSFEQIVDGEWYGSRKPILYSGGIGRMFDEHLEKEQPEIGMHIVQIGGPALPVGVGGGSASSMMGGENVEALDFNAVQRGNAMEENKANQALRDCVEMGPENPIASMHDQGSGGPSNTLTEIVEPLGGTVDIDKIVRGDKTMSDLQVWSGEHQERYSLLIRPERLEVFKAICARRGVNCEVLGEIDGGGAIVAINSRDGSTVVDLNLEQVLSGLPQKTFESTRKVRDLKPLVLPEMTVGEAVERVFKQLSVGSKGFLVHKIDRSVTGLVAQQPCCGIAQIPIADHGIMALNTSSIQGAVVALGEQPIAMLIDPAAGARLAVAESLTNMAGALITDLKDVRFRVNCMWPAKLPHEGPRLYDAYKAMSDFLVRLRQAANGGKDSLSMATNVSFGERTKTPGSLVMKGCAAMPDIRRKVTPEVKHPGRSVLALIDLGGGKNRLGGSALAQSCNQLGNECPDVDDPKLFVHAFMAVQQMIKEGLLFAVHDRTGDGGLMATVAEMCMASRCGFTLNVTSSETALSELFAQEAGYVLEIPESGFAPGYIRKIVEDWGIPWRIIGTTSSDRTCIVRSAKQELYRTKVEKLRVLWESTSYQLERLQTDLACAEEERAGYSAILPGIDETSAYRLTYVPVSPSATILAAPDNPRVAVLRTKGTNGDRELAEMCKDGGLEPTLLDMDDLLTGKATLDSFQGLFYPGGFSYMDVFGSAKGWAGIIRFNPELRAMFERFYDREDTFSFGVCNGCQAMPQVEAVPWRGIEERKQPRFVQNRSGRFESREVSVEILRSPAIMLDDMEGSRLAVVVAHGEGRAFFPDLEILEEVKRQGLIALAYIDPFGHRTEQYPYNPNGSPLGIAGICSSDGRHLAMMPHIERRSRLWQWPWLPPSMEGLTVSPWLRMITNAREWCLAHRN